MFITGANSLLGICIPVMTDDGSGSEPTPGIETTGFYACSTDGADTPFFVQIVNDEEGNLVTYVLHYLDGSGTVTPTTDASLFKTCPVEDLNKKKVYTETIRLSAALGEQVATPHIAEMPGYIEAQQGVDGGTFCLEGDWTSWSIVPMPETPDQSSICINDYLYKMGCGLIAGPSLPSVCLNSGEVSCQKVQFDAKDGGFFEIKITRCITN